MNRPHTLIFDRLQVVNDDIDEWEDFNETEKRSRSVDGPTSAEPSPKRVAVMVDPDDEL